MADERDAEALRRRLYRRDATPADVADYLSTTAAEADTDTDASAEAQPAPPTPGPTLRPFVIGGVAVAAAALLGAVLLTGGPPVPAATPSAAAAAPTAVETQEADGSWTVAFGRTVVLDGGERDHAHGSSVAEGPDRVRYTASSDDTVAAIAARFRLCPADVLQALPYGFDAGGLPAGTVLELAHLDTTTC